MSRVGGGEDLPIPAPEVVGGHPSLFQQGRASYAHRFNKSVFKDQVGRKKHPFPFIVREGPPFCRAKPDRRSFGTGLI